MNACSRFLYNNKEYTLELETRYTWPGFFFWGGGERVHFFFFFFLGSKRRYTWALSVERTYVIVRFASLPCMGSEKSIHGEVMKSWEIVCWREHAGMYSIRLTNYYGCMEDNQRYIIIALYVQLTYSKLVPCQLELIIGMYYLSEQWM